LPFGLNGWWASSNHSGPVRWATLDVSSPWQASSERPIDWTPAFQHANSTLAAAYVSPTGAWVGLHLSFYRQQDYERKLVTSSNVLVTSEERKWSLVIRERDEAEVAGRFWKVDSAVLRRTSTASLHGGQALLAWRFYWVDDTFTSSDVEAKLHGAWGRAVGRGDDGAIIVLYTPLVESLDEPQAKAAAADVLRGFLTAHGAALRRALQSTSEGS
jgi:EpsI family protein